MFVEMRSPLETLRAKVVAGANAARASIAWPLYWFDAAMIACFDWVHHVCGIGDGRVKGMCD